MSAKCLNALTQLKRIACSCLDKQHKAIAGKLGAAKRKGNRKNRVKASTDDRWVNVIQTLHLTKDKTLLLQSHIKLMYVYV